MQKSLLKRESDLFVGLFRDPAEKGRAHFYLAVSLSCLIIGIALSFLK